MTFRRLALSNVRGGWSRYLAYFLSCAFSVMVFYVFFSFIVHPDVVGGHIVGGNGRAVQSGLFAAEMIILVFSFLFILYSTTAFLRSRKKEFGLLTLMGMTQGQMRRMVFYENMLIALFALATGLFSGMVFSKLFFMSMSVLLGVESPIRFAVPLAAVGITVVVFLGVFLTITLLSLFGVRQASIRQLLKAHHQSKTLPKRHPLLLLAGILFIAHGYRMAWYTTGLSLNTNMIPIVGWVVAGTYLLFTQGGVLLCSWLTNRRSYFLKGTNILTLSRLTFRLADNARILFVSAVLVAVVSSSMGAFNTLLQSARGLALDDYAYATSFEIWGTAQDELKIVGRVEDYLREQGACNTRSEAITGLLGYYSYPPVQRFLTVVSNEDYNRAAERMSGIEPMLLEHGEGILVMPWDLHFTDAQPDAYALQAANHQGANNETLDYSIPVKLVTAPVRSWLFGHWTLVVSNDDYASFAVQVPATGQYTFYGFEYSVWERIRVDEDEMGALLDQQPSAVRIRHNSYVDNKQIGALTMFIGLFVSCLFFIAAGSLVYFKLFTELEEDRKQYDILQDVGITRAEVRRAVSRELGTLFLVPLLVGSLHTAFAMKTLSNLAEVRMNIAQAGLMVEAGYAVLQAIYFFVIREAYLKQVLRQL